MILSYQLGMSLFIFTNIGLGVHGVCVNLSIVDEGTLVDTNPLQSRGPIHSN